jgi:hypothetical protein
VHPKIYKSHEDFQRWDQLNEKLAQINEALIAGNEGALLDLLKQLVVGYKQSFFDPVAEDLS